MKLENLKYTNIMKLKNLKYTIAEFTNAVAFQITYQSDACAEFLKANGGSFIARGWVIKIDSVPELNLESKTIYLRNPEYDAAYRVDRTYNLEFDNLLDKQERLYTAHDALYVFDNAVSAFQDGACRGIRLPENSVKINPIVVHRNFIDAPTAETSKTSVKEDFNRKPTIYGQ